MTVTGSSSATKFQILDFHERGKNLDYCFVKKTVVLILLFFIYKVNMYVA